jgi:hypothetical protein
MYSLALIIFVVSEKKAFEHFSIGSNVNADHWKVLYTIYVFYADRKSKMAATAIHSLTLDPMGKCSNAFFSETTNIIKAIKKHKICKEDLPMIIPGQFGSNCPSGFTEEAF